MNLTGRKSTESFFFPPCSLHTHTHTRTQTHTHTHTHTPLQHSDSYLQHAAPLMLHTQGHSVWRTDGVKGTASQSGSHTYTPLHTLTNTHTYAQWIERGGVVLFLIPLQQRTTRQSKTLLFYMTEGGWKVLYVWRLLEYLMLFTLTHDQPDYDLTPVQ